MSPAFVSDVVSAQANVFLGVRNVTYVNADGCVELVEVALECLRNEEASSDKLARGIEE